MEIWLVSDHHFGHENIIGFANRPFEDVGDMDQYMIDEWNRRVKSIDHVYHLGDVTMERGGQKERGKFIKRMRALKGHKRLILGNHDHFPIKTYLEAGFEKIYGTWRGIDNLLLSHIPVHPSSIAGVANVHGHIHQQDSPPPAIWTGKDGVMVIRPYINVSVEQTAYGPITLGEVKDRIKREVAKYEV